MLVDDTGRPVYSLEKIAPGQDYAVPIEAVMQCKVRIQPDRKHFSSPVILPLTRYLEGFGYKWCSAIRWEDLIVKKGFAIRCPHASPVEAAFRFQAWVQTDAPDAVSRYVREITPTY